jgi:hypothetical protein
VGGDDLVISWRRPGDLLVAPSDDLATRVGKGFGPVRICLFITYKFRQQSTYSSCPPCLTRGRHVREQSKPLKSYKEIYRLLPLSLGRRQTPPPISQITRTPTRTRARTRTRTSTRTPTRTPIRRPPLRLSNSLAKVRNHFNIQSQ